MRHLLESSVWLLVPGPKEEERGTEAALASLLFAGIFLLHGIFPNSSFNQFSGLINLAVIPFLVAVFLLSAFLHALPPGRRRARLGAQVLLTLAVVAFVAWFPITRLDLGAYGLPVVVLLVLTLLGANRFFNRRRALRSLDPPIE